MHKRAVNSACRHADNFVMSLCSMEPSVKGFLLRRRAIIGLLGLLLSIWTVRWLMPNDGRPFWMSEDTQIPSSSDNNKDTAKGKQPNPQASSQPSAAAQQNPGYSVDLSDLDAPYVGWPLRRVCEEVEPVEGVVWVCDKNWGGMGNIRNFILNCLRYGIEAGATGLVMPEIHLRDEEDITDYITPLKAPFSYMFDEAHFRTAMGENCPHITIYNSTRDVPYFDATAATTATGELPIPEVDPRTLVSVPQKCDAAETDRHVDRFGERFRAYMSSGTSNGTTGTMTLLQPPSSTAPRLFRMVDKDKRPALPVMWAWPVHRDGAEFANTFGTLLRFHPRLMRLGRRALEGMHEFSRTIGDEEAGFEKRGAGRGRDRDKDREGREGKFLGVHLRSEIDAEKFWPTYAEQREAYLGKAGEQNLTSVAYVACGDAGQIARFGGDAQARLGMTVVSKTDVLAGADLAELEGLTWDQQAIVDFVVLAGSDYFVGNSRSSFSIFLAQRRHLRADGLYTRQYKVRSQGFGRSFVVGPKELYFDHWLFIWDAAWP